MQLAVRHLLIEVVCRALDGRRVDLSRQRFAGMCGVVLAVCEVHRDHDERLITEARRLVLVNRWDDLWSVGAGCQPAWAACVCQGGRVGEVLPDDFGILCERACPGRDDEGCDRGTDARRSGESADV